MPEIRTDRVEATISAGAEWLFRQQRADGSWCNDGRPTSPFATGSAVLALHFADPAGSAELIDRGAAWLRDHQNPDGGWAGAVGGPTALVPTVVALCALEVVSAERSAAAIERGLDRVRALGGVESIQDPVFVGMCRTFQSLAGWYDEAQLRRIPLELLLVLPPGRRHRLLSLRTIFFSATGLMQSRRRPAGRLRRTLNRLAEPRAMATLRYIYEHEGRVASFGSSPFAAGWVCVGLARAGVMPDLVAAVVSFLRSAVRPDGSWHAVHDMDLTGGSYATRGLLEAGYRDDPRLAGTRDWLHRCQQRTPFEPYGAGPGGWSWSGPRGWPVILESAEIVSVLAAFPDRDRDEHLVRGVAWLRSMQDSRGSWSTFVRDSRWANDGPCPYITGLGILALLDAGVPAGDRQVAAAVRWLLGAPDADGAFETLWYPGSTPGTAVALRALVRSGHGDHPVARRARDWLLAAQREDGSWGSETGSDDAGVELTAWALSALIAAGVSAGDERVERAVRWLTDAMGEDGRWPMEPVGWFTRHLVNHYDPLMTNGLAVGALAAYRAAAQPGRPA